jgi:esterase
MLLNYQLKKSVKHELNNKNEIIFIVHGLFGSLSNLSGLAKELQANFDVILVDVRNHGRSPRDKSMTYQEMAEDIFELADELAIDQFSIIGHSMGGKIAMSCALLQPQRVKRLVVADIAPVSYGDRHSNVFMGLKSVLQLQAKNRIEAEKTLAGYIETPEVRQFLLKSFQRTEDGFDFLYDVDNLYNNYHFISAWPEYKNSYDRSTLFIKGQLSNYIDDHNSALIFTMFPNATMETIEGTGHWLHAEKPQIFNGLVIEFFKQ